MKLTEDQANLLVKKVVLRRPCINCGASSNENSATPGSILKIVKMPAVIPVVEVGSAESKDVILTFLVATRLHCGYTSFIDVDAIGINIG